MTELVARMLFPFSLIMGAAIWAKGYSAVGDGFSAGVAAGLGAVVQYVCLRHERAARVVRAHASWWLMGAGLLLALGVLIGPTLFGLAPVTHFPRPGAHVIKLGVLDLHTALLFDLGTAMLVCGAMICTFDRLFALPREDVA